MYRRNRYSDERSAKKRIPPGVRGETTRIIASPAPSDATASSEKSDAIGLHSETLRTLAR